MFDIKQNCTVFHELSKYDVFLKHGKRHLHKKQKKGNQFAELKIEKGNMNSNKQFNHHFNNLS